MPSLAVPGLAGPGPVWLIRGMRNWLVLHRMGLGEVRFAACVVPLPRPTPRHGRNPRMRWSREAQSPLSTRLRTLIVLGLISALAATPLLGNEATQTWL